ncbi:MAG: transposase [Methanobacteriaceae archaeon]|nr:transposase [Methanobacteriaceae archaeon]
MIDKFYHYNYNINLIFLPPYSPKLNRIEQVWRTIKKRISRYYYESKETLKEQFHKIFYEIIEKNFILRRMEKNISKKS